MNKHKKYILKPGRHQFAPAGAAVHDNNNLTDKEAAWYIKKYPHITSLFIALPADKVSGTVKLKSLKTRSKLKATLVAAVAKEEPQ